MRLFIIAILFVLQSCSSNDDTIKEDSTNKLYFPPINADSWEKTIPSSLNWDETKLQELYTYLEDKNTKGFIILKNGKLVIEKYFNGHSNNSIWYWASAGKTLTTAMIGIAENEGYLNLNDKASIHLGTGWTSVSLAKENLITISHLLSMTSGLNDTLGDDVSPENLKYVSDAGTRWAYHNVYVKLQDIIATASKQTYAAYFNTKLRDRIGMTGNWITLGNNSVYWSNTRSMARFGLLSLNYGNWDGSQIVNKNYFQKAVSTSQTINQSYGYLWWLNGKSNYHLPQTQIEFQGSLIESAPDDMYCALGKNDQKIYVVPSQNLVIVRMGESAENAELASSSFDNELWVKINLVIN
ncbi:serine hydrolase [Aureibaculum sp. A20]|uniref:Serine hydrolase n=1 Tax=Aureibaculum flavum TaxID=2795986 RepID=A0ABS0WWD9_9FLAO|nr:serine hydrolase [Aureibaculum flavum]MBJ2176308.1 serine hydrolase [Aureibaculum flavum]